MAYVSDWERLPDALKRVMASGIEEDEAKQDLCNAIADRKIEIRGLVAKEEGLGSFGERVVGTVRHGGEIEIPSHLSSRDFDWDNSRPVSPWQESPIHNSVVFAARRHLEWIEVFTADVTNLLCGGTARDGGVPPQSDPNVSVVATAAFPKRQWPEPQADWLPLSQAIFRIGIGDGPGSRARHEKPLQELTLNELATMLREKSHASEAEIDPVNATFLFSFHTPGRDVSRMGGAPWAILGNFADNAINSDPRLDAEALFNKEGFVRIGDDDAARYAKQLDAVRKATSLVWRQFMLRAFDRAISAKRTGSGPPVIRLSERRLIFRVADLRTWLAARTTGHAEIPPRRRRGRPQSKRPAL